MSPNATPRSAPIADFIDPLFQAYPELTGLVEGRFVPQPCASSTPASARPLPKLLSYDEPALRWITIFPRSALEAQAAEAHARGADGERLRHWLGRARQHSGQRMVVAPPPLWMHCAKPIPTSPASSSISRSSSRSRGIRRRRISM